MKTIVFDFDGTLTKKYSEIWSKMWQSLDAKDVDNKLFNQFKKGIIDYDAWCKEIEKEYIKRGFNLDILNNLIKDIQLMDHLEETLKELKSQGYVMYIVSGGVKKVIYDLLGDLATYFNQIFAVDFVFDNKGYLTKIIPTKYDEEGKKVFIDEYCKMTNTKPNEIVFVGNGDNDEYVFLSGCKTICINPISNVNYDNKKIWHKVILDSSDMRDILSCIGECL